MKKGWELRALREEDEPEWLRMRQALWSDSEKASLMEEMREIKTETRQVVFVLERPTGGLGGFVEAALRPWAEGCSTHPVGYIEGWYVDPDLRKQGAGQALVQAAEAWARAKGSTEMASDCELENTTSLQAHLRLGYSETLRIIQFRKSLPS